MSRADIDMERWRMGDPFYVVARMEEQQQREYAQSRQGKAERAKQGMRELFEEEEGMGRRINLPDHILDAMHSWGEWARRPQFWQNLGSTPFYRLLPLPESARVVREVRLDPLAHNIHRAVMRMESDITRAVLYISFVRGDAYADHPALAEHGITYSAFIECIKTGSHAAYKQARRELDRAQQNSVTK